MREIFDITVYLYRALVTSLSTSVINKICTLKARFSGTRHPIVLYSLTES
jgi:hypothetical protein